MGKRRRYAVLLCAEDSDYVRKVHGGYFQVFLTLLRAGAGGENDEEEEEEDWEVFRACRGDLPRGDVAIDRFDGFVITGSCTDAHGDDDWIVGLVAFLRRLDSMRKKVLGICFGHQILCRALGGKTGRAKKGWDVGVINVSFSAEALKLLPHPRQLPASLAIIECHRDEVWQLPVGAEAMARSDKTEVEMFRYGENVMGLQGHPEYTKDILLSLVDSLLRCKVIEENYAEMVKARLAAEKEPDRETWRRLCRGFLNGKLYSSNGVGA